MVELWSTILTQKYDPYPKIFNIVAILHLNEVSSIVRGVKSMSAEMNTQAYGSSFLIPHTYPGRLIAAEGLDGSGKSTQLHLLQFWLQAEGYEVLSTELTASKLIKRALKAGKKQGSMDPMLLSILHAADFAEIYERDILPALQRGAVGLDPGAINATSKVPRYRRIDITIREHNRDALEGWQNIAFIDFGEVGSMQDAQKHRVHRPLFFTRFQCSFDEFGGCQFGT